MTLDVPNIAPHTTSMVDGLLYEMKSKGAKVDTGIKFFGICMICGCRCSE